ncbi:MAG TPA: hypothetical protein DD473_27600 [Planctomycetaceae bacterium]|nr:hypothetical protein [Planctomycetaceae bacterium]
MFDVVANNLRLSFCSIPAFLACVFFAVIPAVSAEDNLKNADVEFSSQNENTLNMVLTGLFHRSPAPWVDSCCDGCCGDECYDSCTEPSGDECTGCCDDLFCESDVWTRSTMLPKSQFRNDLECHGIDFKGYASQFYQNVTGGGASRDSEYGGKIDYFLTLDGGKMGFNKGLFVNIHAETRFGQDVNGPARQVSPPNINMLMPNGEQESAITGLYVQQMLNEEIAVVGGKFNSYDLFELIVQTGRGVDGFMNASLVLPTVLARTTSLSFLGAGVMKIQKEGVEGALLVYDTQNSATETGIDDLFSEGAVVLGMWRKFYKIDGKAGYQGIVGNYSSRSYRSVDPSSFIFVPGQGIVVGEESGSWTLTHLMSQTLWQDCCHPKRNITAYTQFGISDGNPNPIAWSGSASVTANGMIHGRENDAIGIGYYYLGLSGDFKQLVNPVVSLRDTQGVELYYKAAVTPWLAITADIQIMDPAQKAQDTTTVAGLRAVASF